MIHSHPRHIKIEKTAVIGAGSWGTAIAKLLADKGENVVLWGHRPEYIERIKRTRENSRYLPGFVLPENLSLEKDLKVAVCGADCVVMVVPSHGYREVFSRLVPYLETGVIVVSAVKGIETYSLVTMTSLMEEEVKDKDKNFGVLSGPSFAREVADNQPTAVTIAFNDLEVARAVQQLFAGKYFRGYTSTDVIGLEISGAMKNVIAIAAGICDGLGFGLNSRAALMTRGLAEITRIGVAMGANPLTFSGLGGLGDLVLTCTGNLSRNRTVGLEIGKGRELSVVLSEMTMVAEGVKTTKSCYNLAKKLGVEMPILKQIYQILYEKKSPHDAVRELFKRDLREELDEHNF
jgi:glycerol-3-phosphate dehydrogenase (NAD(P)+)